MAPLGLLGRAALSYGSAGWFVHPLLPGDKRPATPNGVKDATTDPEQITAWWTATPDANIGIATGPSGLVVIDCDLRIGDDGTIKTNGLAAWCAVVAEHVAKEPRSFEVETPTGGVHIYFRAPADRTIRNSAGKLGVGIDVRGDGGYVVAAPSRRPDGTYKVVEQRDVIPVPSWLLELLDPPRRVSRVRSAPSSGRGYGQAALAAEVDNVRRAAEGTRNETLHVAAFNCGQLCHDGRLDSREAARALLDAAAAAGLDEKEAVATIASAFKGAASKPRGRVA